MPQFQKPDLASKEHIARVEKFRKVKPVIFPVTGLPAGRATPSARQSAITTGLEAYVGEWTDKQAAHLLRRTLFGIKKSELQHFKSLDISSAVDEILTATDAPAPPVNDYNSTEEGVEDPVVPFGETWIEAPHADDKEGNRVVSLKCWVIKNMLHQQPSIHEKITLFWHNLLVSKVWDVYIAKTGYRYFETLRNNALGNYRTLIKAITLDPSMLLFLNGTYNNKDAPDENYGRELQELFCIGKGPGSKYTEADVQEAARVLTGWTISWDSRSKTGTFSSSFNANLHATSDKQFSAFYDNKIIRGKTGSDGAKELDELIGMITGNEECSRYICRRLYTFFVYSVIDDATEETVIKPLAEIFKNNGYEILPVLKTLFKSAHFYDALNIGAQIKNPADHFIGTWRTLEAPCPAPEELLKNYSLHRSMLWNMSGMGLEIGDPPNVAGWQAYYQAPQFDKAWIATDTVTMRAQATDSLIYWGYWVSEDNRIKVNLPDFVKRLDFPADPVLLLKESSKLLMGIEFSDVVINNLKSILLSGQQNDSYWRTAWNAYIADPGNEINKTTIETRLQSAFQRMLQMGEYQLM